MIGGYLKDLKEKLLVDRFFRHRIRIALPALSGQARNNKSSTEATPSGGNKPVTNKKSSAEATPSGSVTNNKSPGTSRQTSFKRRRTYRGFRRSYSTRSAVSGVLSAATTTSRLFDVVKIAQAVDLELGSNSSLSKSRKSLSLGRKPSVGADEGTSLRRDSSLLRRQSIFAAPMQLLSQLDEQRAQWQYGRTYSSLRRKSMCVSGSAGGAPLVSANPSAAITASKYDVATKR